MFEVSERGFYSESFVKRVRLLHVSLSAAPILQVRAATQTSRSVAPAGVPRA
jgi:hypothetical protein